MQVTIKINNNGNEFQMEVSGTNAEILTAQRECANELEPGGTITLIETATGRQISWARKPRQ
jgi:hypothetical protein